MGGACSNHDQHSKNFEKQDRINSDFEKRISTLERRVDVSDEKFKQVFEKLDEIIVILKVNQSRLPNLAWGVLGSVMGGVAIWIVMQAIQK